MPDISATLWASGARGVFAGKSDHVLRRAPQTIEWTAESVAELARIAVDVNPRTANIGARRLHTVLERLLDDLLYNAPDIGRQTIPITKAYVIERLGALAADDDLARFIL